MISVWLQFVKKAAFLHDLLLDSQNYLWVCLCCGHPWSTHVSDTGFNISTGKCMRNCDKLETFIWNQPKDTIKNILKKYLNVQRKLLCTIWVYNIILLVTYFVLQGQYFIWFCTMEGRNSFVIYFRRASLINQLVKNLPAMQETPVWSRFLSEWIGLGGLFLLKKTCFYTF